MRPFACLSSVVIAVSGLVVCPHRATAIVVCELATVTSGNPPLSDGFGSATAMDDPYLVVGAAGDDTLGSGAGAVYVYLREDTSWTQQVKLTASDAEWEDGFGFSVDIEGDRLVAGAPGISTFDGQFGKAYVFQREGASWTVTVHGIFPEGRSRGR